MQTKGYLSRLLAFLLLPVLVVSLPALDDDRPTNEAGSGEKQGGLIAEAEVPAIRARRVPEGFPVTLHQQSTNAAAAKRDLQYNKRTARASKLLVGEATSLRERRFLPGQINVLSSKAGEDEVYQTQAAFLPPRIVYLDSALPQPFVRPEHKERGRVFSLTNFLIKDKKLMNPKSFDFNSKSEKKDHDNESIKQNEPMIKHTDIPVISTPLKAELTNSFEEEKSQNFDLYRSIIEEEDSILPLSFKANSVSEDIDDDNLSLSTSEELRENERFGIQQQSTNIDEKGSKYDFGYRVIDHTVGSDYGHEEHRGARGAARSGKYHVLLPDGRVQRVEYSADHLGYRPVITYISQYDYENRP